MQLTLSTLGTLRASTTDAQGNTRTLSRGKPVAMLAYLACIPGHKASREHLAALLWGDVDSDAARQNLRQTIWYLKKKLGDGLLDATGEVLARIRDSHRQDAGILIEPRALAGWLQEDKTIRLLDVRSREEFEAVHVDGSVLMSQPVMQQIMGEGTNARPLVIIDHQGKQGLDAAAYFLGHGLTNVRCLRGGIDAWSQEVDPKVDRKSVV